MKTDPGRHRRSEAGTTLIELVVAVAIMGVAFVSIIGGIGMAVIGAATQKQQTSSSLALRTAAEAIAYQPWTCSNTNPPQAVPPTYPAPASPPGITVSVARVSLWNSDTNAFEATPPPPSPCQSDTGLQLIELTATSTTPQQQVTRTLKVEKRRP